MVNQAPSETPVAGKHKLPYQALKANELRLLTIHPALSSQQSLIQCSLEHVSLEDSNCDVSSTKVSRYRWGDYVAISYCWGWDAEKPSQQIFINGYTVSVTESLKSALHCIRDSIQPNEVSPWPVRYWIDAVCIDQSDLPERQREIMRMKDIYGQSMSVFVHLGPETDDSTLGVQFLKLTATELKAGVDCAGALLAHRFNTNQKYRASYRAVLQLLCRPYWYRVWILQELGMSNGTITVGCGRHTLQFQDIVSVARFICLNTESVSLVTGVGLEAEFGRLMTTMWVAMWAEAEKHRRQRAEDNDEITYLDLRYPLLTLAQNAQATKAHDKVYGLLGLMPDAIRKRVEPFINYKLPIETVFTALSRAVIEVTGSLDMVFAKNFEQTMKPTWATDWTLQFDRAGFPHDWLLYCYDQFDGAYEDLSDVIEASRKVRADGGRKSTVQSFNSADSNLLKCKGCRIGTLDGIAPFMPGNTSKEGIPDGSFTQSTGRTNPYGDDKATSRSLVHVLFGNHVWGDNGGAALFHIPWLLEEGAPILNADNTLFVDDKMNSMFGQLREKGWKTVLSNNFFVFEWWRRRIGPFIIGGKRFMDYFDREITQCEFPDQRIRLDMATALGACVGRRLVTLETGHFGLAPGTVQAGDEIYVLIGSSAPVVLRPVLGGRFEVVGECYVEGFVKGEAVTGLDRGKFELQSITLC